MSNDRAAVTDSSQLSPTSSANATKRWHGKPQLRRFCRWSIPHPGNLAPVFEAMLERALHPCDASFGSLLRFDGEFFHRARRTV